MTAPEFDFDNVTPYSIDLPPEIELSIHKLESKTKAASIEVLRQSFVDTYRAMRVQALHYDRDLKEQQKTLDLQARDLAEAMQALRDRGETIENLERQNAALKSELTITRRTLEEMRLVMDIFTRTELKPPRPLRHHLRPTLDRAVLVALSFNQ